MEEKYILQKDLPDGSLAGDIYKKRGDMYYNVRLDELEKCVCEHLTWFTWQVEKNPEWFQKSKQQENKDWDIVSFKNSNGNIFTLTDSGYYAYEGDRKPATWRTAEHILTEAHDCKIFSVRRLSDNSVWSVGDWIQTGNGKIDSITGFKILNENMYVNAKTFGFMRNINEIKHEKQRIPLFHTDDTIPVPVYPKDKYFCVVNFQASKEQVAYVCCTYGDREDIKYFATEQSANEYIFHKKPCMCYDDVMGKYEQIINRFSKPFKEHLIDSVKEKQKIKS